MKLEEFRRLVYQEFGKDLDRATPANVREFLDKMQLGEFSDKRAYNPRHSLEDPSRSYEEIVKDTFAKLLKLPAEEAVPMLWVIAFELFFSIIEFQYSDTLEPLFQNID